ncbi:MAG TPA: orotidine-5'-phosphate decarboxylase [Candidatus Manganitrophaceae bacterium]|nr:orotidine-5'-phosphate decarboxylase [Candidatus Manganitrophaceae bacterium]
MPVNLSAKDRIVLPLDVGSFDEAKATIRKLKDGVGLFKVGLTLFVKEGKRLLEQLQDEVGGGRIFLDLKFHDIPETVGHASSAVASFGVRFLTVHASDGERILKAAVAAMPEGSQVLGITVLTSLAESELRDLGIAMPVKERVLALAKVAGRAGCGGIVCSGLEAGDVKQACGRDFLVVTPGIRPAWTQVPGDDQRRVMTPGEAIRCGADYVVVGRPIYTASDPRGAAEKVAEEIEAAFQRPSTKP